MDVVIMQISTTRTGVDRCGAIMVTRMCGVDSFRGRDKMIDRHYINKLSCMKVC